MQRREFQGQIGLGILLVLVGGAILLGTLGVVDAGNLIQWIPSLFILMGLWQLISSGGRD